MSNLCKFFVVLFLILVPMVHLSMAQVNEEEAQYTDSSSFSEDKASFVPRAIAQADWRALTSDSAFSYRDKVEAETKPSTPSKFELWLEKVVASLFQFLFSTGGKIIFWLIVLVLLGFLLLKIFKGDMQFLFSRKERQLVEQVADEMSTEDVMNTNWESKMSLALREGNMRLATRFLFVSALQLLHQKQHILYGIDKTNFDYYRMIEKEELKPLYRVLMTRFEYVWFGQKTINEQEWKSLMQVYEQLNLKS